MISRRAAYGLTLIEVLVTILILAVVLLPAMRALQTSVTGANVHADLAADHFRLTSRLEEILAEPFDDLEAAAMAAGGPGVASSYSDAAGPPDRLLVYVAAYDGDNADADDDPFTGTDAGLLWIQVEAEGTIHKLQSIKAQGF